MKKTRSFYCSDSEYEMLKQFLKFVRALFSLNKSVYYGMTDIEIADEIRRILDKDETL